MFSSVAVLTSLAAGALALSPGDLTVSLKAVSSSVDAVNDVVITAVVSNPTSEDIRVLAANNVLDTSATKSFDVTADGKDVPFAGIMATYDLTHDGLYVTIPAGKSHAVNHTLGSYFDFSSFAPGTTFTVSTSSALQSAPDDKPLFAKADAVDVKVTKDVAFKGLFEDRGSSLERRAAQTSTPTCSDGGKLSVIQTGLRYARSLAGGAATDIRSHPTGPEYTTYFGGNNQDDIWYNFDRVAGDLPANGNRNIYCASDYSDASSYCNSNQGVIAYTVIISVPDNTPIYVCDLYFQAGTTPSVCQNGYDSTMSSTGGIILHELTHAVDGTDDVTYGCSACAQLSAADKKRNADNYRCMGLNIYLDYNCVNGPL